MRRGADCRRRMLRQLPVWFALALVACGTSRQVPDVGIRLTADTVRLNRTAEGASFRARFVIRNDGLTPIFGPPACSFDVQRQEGTDWRTVWQPPVCLAAQAAPPRIAPGDSLTKEVVAFVFARADMVPNDTTALVPGRYRLVFLLGRKETPGSVSDMLPLSHRTSPSFVLSDSPGQ